MKNNKVKESFLEQLKRTPVVQVACEKAGVSRATVYRWRKEDAKFAKAMDAALEEGEDLVNDMAESALLSSIREKNMTGIIFWLKSRHERFKAKLQIEGKLVTSEELTPEQEVLVREALKLTALDKPKEKNDAKEKGYDEKGNKIIFRRS